MRQTILIDPIGSKVSDLERAVDALLRFQTLDIPVSTSSGSIKYDQTLVHKMEQHYSSSGYAGCGRRGPGGVAFKGQCYRQASGLSVARFGADWG
jgi:hypothetical protein